MGVDVWKDGWTDRHVSRQMMVDWCENGKGFSRGISK